MAFEFGFFNEFSDSVTVACPEVAGVAKAISLGMWDGAFFQSMGAPMKTIATKSFKIDSRHAASKNGAVGTGGWDNDDTTGLLCSAGFVNGVTKGHVIQVGDEVMVISAVNRAANTVSVFKRGDGGTTAASHSAAAVIEVIGFAGSDTDLKDVEASNAVTGQFVNGVQTIFEVLDWTKHGELLREGLDPAQATVLLLREKETAVAKMLGIMAIRGRKNIPTDMTTRFMSAGLIQQLTDTNSGAREVLTYNANGSLTQEKLDAAISSVIAAGGSPDTIWCSPTVKGYIDAFAASNSALAIQTAKDNHVGGGVYATSYDFQGSVLRVRVDSAMPNANLAIVNQGLCKKGWLVDDGLRMVDEPAASSREFRKSLQGSVGFVVEGVGSEHCLVTGITGGPSERVSKVYVNGGTVTTVTGGTASG